MESKILLEKLPNDLESGDPPVDEEDRIIELICGLEREIRMNDNFQRSRRGRFEFCMKARKPIEL